jgi:CMP-N-acetylneuraminic acid synthetase
MQPKNTTGRTAAHPLCTLGVIPARGGSKRLPRKNIKNLCGKPLIAYTIQAARNASLLTDFLVSSEDDEILKIARSYGAPTPFKRPGHLATDAIRNIDVVAHAMHYMENKNQHPYDILILLQPTCPIRNPAHIDTAIQLLSKSDLETVVSVKGPFKKRDPILKRIKNGVLESYCPNENPDEIEPFYLYNASIYGVKRSYFIKEKKLISDRQIPIIMDQYHSVDIDTEADFLVAEAYLNFKNNKLEGPANGA